MSHQSCSNKIVKQKQRFMCNLKKEKIKCSKKLTENCNSMKPPKWLLFKWHRYGNKSLIQLNGWLYAIYIAERNYVCMWQTMVPTTWEIDMCAYEYMHMYVCICALFLCKYILCTYIYALVASKIISLKITKAFAIFYEALFFLIPFLYIFLDFVLYF